MIFVRFVSKRKSLPLTVRVFHVVLDMLANLQYLVNAKSKVAFERKAPEACAFHSNLIL